MPSQLEHVNFTVSDPQATAEMLQDIFGWHIHWEGEAKNNGHTIHIGTDDDYLAIYRPPNGAVRNQANDTARGWLNHVGVVVEDLDAVEERVKARGLVPISHGDYEPGRRFYFHDTDGIEYEVVSYT